MYGHELLQFSTFSELRLSTTHVWHINCDINYSLIEIRKVPCLYRVVLILRPRIRHHVKKKNSHWKILNGNYTLNIKHSQTQQVRLESHKLSHKFRPSNTPRLDHVKWACRVSEFVTVKPHTKVVCCHITSSWSNDKDQIKTQTVSSTTLYSCIFTSP